MPTCKNCGTKIKLLSYLLVRGDGLCDECGARYEAERKDPTAAERHMHELLDKLAPQTEWLLCGLGLWTTTGHRASQTASLWAGRALFGVAGDMVHSESRLLGIFGLSANGVLHRLRIGECSNITPRDSLRLRSHPARLRIQPQIGAFDCDGKTRGAQS